MKIKNLKILIPFLFLSLLLLPSICQAFDPANWIQLGLAGVKGVSVFVFRFILTIFILLILTYLFLGVSASLLQQAILTPINLNNTFVWSGWTFTLGLANTFFILIAVIIALSYILKIETFAQKKVLVNLILVALLVNFSLVLVTAMADIGNILSNTIIGRETNLVSEALHAVTGNIYGQAIGIGIMIGAEVALLANPTTALFINVAKIMKFLILPLTIPLLIQWFFTIIFGMGLAGMLFIYWLFFTIRIYIFWALAILAPLAFICLILPATQSWWQEWVKHLTEWTFLGVVLILWLTLGLKLGNTIVLPPPYAYVPLGAYFALGATIRYLLFLFTYLAIGMYLMSKTMPALGDVALKSGTAITGLMTNVGKVLAPSVASSLRRGIIERTPKLEEKEKEIAEKEEKGGLSRREKAAVGLKSVAVGLEKGVHRGVRGWYKWAKGTTIEEAEEENLKSLEEEISQCVTPEAAMVKFERYKKLCGPVFERRAGIPGMTKVPGLRGAMMREIYRKYLFGEDIPKDDPKKEEKTKGRWEDFIKATKESIKEGRIEDFEPFLRTIFPVLYKKTGKDEERKNELTDVFFNTGLIKSEDDLPEFRQWMLRTVSEWPEARQFPMAQFMFAPDIADEVSKDIIESKAPHAMSFLFPRWGARSIKPFMDKTRGYLQTLGVKNFKREYEPVYNFLTSSLALGMGVGITPKQWKEFPEDVPGSKELRSEIDKLREKLKTATEEQGVEIEEEIKAAEKELDNIINDKRKKLIEGETSGSTSR